MILPAAAIDQAPIENAVRELEVELRPDVARIRCNVGEDWNGEWAVYFRVVLSDDAANKRLREAAERVVWRLSELLDFPALGVFPYHNFRSESEQAFLRGKEWD